MQKRIAIERRYGNYTSKYPQKIGLPVKKIKNGYTVKVVSPVLRLPSRGPVKVLTNVFPANQLRHFKKNQAIK